MNDPSETFSATRYILIGFVTLMMLVGGFGIWATTVEISGAIIAKGHIEVDQKRQIVQHLEGGTVAEILVHEGDIVNDGDPLILLDDSLITSEITILEGQLYELIARRGRLESERDNTDGVTFDLELLQAAAQDADIQDLLDGQVRLFSARKATWDKEVVQLEKQRRQITDQIAGIAAQSKALSTQLTLINKELSSQQTLLRKGLAQATQVLSLQREEARLLGQFGKLAAAKAQAEGRITELDTETLKLATSRREDAITKLRDIQFRELELKEQRNVLKHRLAGLSIRAPVSGVVYGMTVFADNSVVRPADPLLFLVPQDRPLVIAAQIEPIHIEQVHVGQDVILRLSTFDQKTTPELTGMVNQVSADAFVDDATKRRYYKAEILISKGEIERLPEHLTLIPGMPVESFLRTNNRTPLAYLVKPFTDYFTRAFRES